MPAAPAKASRATVRVKVFMCILPSIDQRGLDHAPELHAQVAGIGLVGLHHIDGIELLLGIDPEGRARRARPAIFADRTWLRRSADRGAHLEAETEAEARRAAGPGSGVVGSHELERL